MSEIKHEQRAEQAKDDDSLHKALPSGFGPVPSDPLMPAERRTVAIFCGLLFFVVASIPLMLFVFEAIDVFTSDVLFGLTVAAMYGSLLLFLAIAFYHALRGRRTRFVHYVLSNLTSKRQKDAT